MKISGKETPEMKKGNLNWLPLTISVKLLPIH